MNRLSLLTYLVLLTTTPALVAQQTHSHPVEKKKLNSNFKNPRRYHLLPYDKIIALLSEVESGDAKKHYTKEDKKHIDKFLAYLAKLGSKNYNRALAMDIADLLLDDCYEFAVSTNDDIFIIPAIDNGQQDIILCQNWFKKQWKKTKNFVGNHKEEVIIGAIILIAAAAVVVIVAAPGTAPAVLAAAGVVPSLPQNATAPAIQDSMLEEVIREHIDDFKTHVVKESYFQNNKQEFSWEETGRVLSSVLAQQTIDDVRLRVGYYPQISSEVQPLCKQIELENSYIPQYFGQELYNRQFEIDKSLATPTFEQSAYHMRGHQAYSMGHFNQAVQDFGRVIELDPHYAQSYLDRGIAYFQLGEYDKSIQDYNQYAKTQKSNPLSIPEFSLGFAAGLPKGIYDSGKGNFLLISDAIVHPVNTVKQMWEALTILSALAKSEEWLQLSEALAPEIYHLVAEWDTLSSDKRGELAGYAFGKYGADIIIPGAAAKVFSRGLKGAKELATVIKTVKSAENTLVLETVANLNNPSIIASMIETGQQTLSLGEELGFAAKEMGQLKHAGKLETTVNSTFEHLTPSMQESVKLFERAKEKLKPFQGKYMLESEARELIHSTGIPTFKRPTGIPKDYKVKLSGKPGGMKYVHPQNEGTYVRIMPGKPHSKNPCQQKPYVNQRINGKSLDKYGNIITNKSENAHIPLEEFIYREIGKG